MWSVLARCEDDKTRMKWELAIGYWLNPETKLLKIDPALHHQVTNCSINELVDFLSGAPMPLAKTYISLLPDQKLAKKVALHFRKEDLPALSEAFYRPKPLQIKEPDK